LTEEEHARLRQAGQALHDELAAEVHHIDPADYSDERVAQLLAQASRNSEYLPKRRKEVSLKVATWSEELLQRADETAASVIRGLRERVFWPPEREPPRFSEVYSDICQDELPVFYPDEYDEEKTW